MTDDWKIIETIPSDDTLLVADTKTAKNIDVTTRTFFNWDRSAEMAAQGWPQPVKINGRKYRRLGALRRFFATAGKAGEAEMLGRPPDKNLGPPWQEAPKQISSENQADGNLGELSGESKYRALKTIAEIQKSHSSRLRVGIFTWRGRHKLELRELISNIPGIYFPSRDGVFLDIRKLPELIEALEHTLHQARERGMLAAGG